MLPQPPLALVADDLTGSCDAGVQFLGTGWNIEVLLEPTQPLPTDADLVVICTNTRGLAPDEAHRIVLEFAGRLKSSGRRLLFKKFDSTLHGNFGAEIQALLDAGAASEALICPAFPAMGRRLHHGQLLMGDDRHPVGRNLIAMLQEQASREVVALDRNSLLAPTLPLARHIQEAVDQGQSLFAFDADSESDLAALVTLAAARPGSLLCGSTGLARHLGQALAKTNPPNPLTGTAQAKIASQLTCILGSNSPVTRQQVQTLVELHQAHTGNLDSPESWPPPNLRTPQILSLNLATATPRRLEPALRQIVALGPRALMLSGGDTARLVCTLAGVRTILLEGEIETGFPYGTLQGGWFDGWPVATKAGGFGDRDSLVRCAHFFENPSR